MLIQAILVALCTWVCASGIEFACWSIQLCSPICFGPIIGLIMGDVQLGLQIGAMTQVVYMGNIMIGGVSTVDYAVAGCIATALAIASNASPEMGVTIAVSLGIIGMIATTVNYTAHTYFVHKADECAANADTKGIVMYNVFWPQVFNFITYAIPAFLAIYYGADVVTSLLDKLPGVIIASLEAFGMLLPALGLAMLMKSLLKLEFLPYFIFGYILSVYVGLGMIPVALVGIAFAIMYWYFG